MKCILYILSFLSFLSCSKPTSLDYQESKPITIAGRILNSGSETKKLRFVIERLGFDQDVTYLELDSTGCFSMSFDSYIPTDVLITYSNHLYILTHPGDSIYLEFEGTTEFYNTLKFGGAATKVNEDAAAIQSMLYRAKIGKDKKVRDRVIKESEPEEYKAYCDSLRTKKLLLLDDFTMKYSPKREVQIWAQNYIEEQYCYALTSYPSIHRSSNNLPKEWDVPFGYYDFLTERLPITDSMLVSSYSLSGYINDYQYYYVYLNIWEKNKGKYKYENGYFYAPKEIIDSLQVYGIIEYTQDTLFRQLVLTSYFSQSFGRSSIDLYEKYSKIADLYIKEPFLREPLRKQYQQLKERFENPKFASNATLNKMENTSIKSMMDSILIRNKGKVIYLDSWATWCGPCLSEFPNSIRLMEDMKDTDVSFVFLCINSEEEKWKATLNKYQLGGQHYFLNNEQSIEFRKIFDVTGIPHYFLFDKQGTIIEKGSHLRPNSIKPKLESLLQKN